MLLLPVELLESWGGTTTADYERACDVYDEVAVLDVGDGVALVLGDVPHQTAWAADSEGGMLVRWVYADDEADIWKAVDRVGHADFVPSAEAAFTVGSSGRCMLLDSTDPGGDLRGEHLEVSLAPGRYRVQTAEISPNEVTRVLVHRLRRQQ